MNTINLVIAGKGGVGKSYVSALLAQYITEKGNKPVCIDTDTNNGTFSSYKAFNAKRFSVIDDDFIIHQSFLDDMLSYIVNQNEDTVIDVGASSFNAFCAWMKEFDLAEVMEAYGLKILVHLVMEGGANTENSLIDLNTVMSVVKAPVVIWENRHRGPVIFDGNPLAEIHFIKDNPSIKGIIVIPENKTETKKSSILLMTKNHLTFQEIDAIPDIWLQHKSRLSQYWIEIKRSIDAVLDGEFEDG